MPVTCNIVGKLPRPVRGSLTVGMVPKDVEHRLAAILKADVAGYSRLMAQDEDETVRTRSD